MKRESATNWLATLQTVTVMEAIGQNQVLSTQATAHATAYFFYGKKQSKRKTKRKMAIIILYKTKRENQE